MSDGAAVATWLDREELAYGTPTGSCHGSRRRARALCDDGKLRTFAVGVPDTYFSIPAVGKWAGKYAKGYVYTDGNGVLRFYRHTSRDYTNPAAQGN